MHTRQERALSITPDSLMWLAYITWGSSAIALSGLVFDIGLYWLPSYLSEFPGGIDESHLCCKTICGNAEEAVEMVLITGGLLSLKTVRHLGLGPFLSA